MNVYLKHEELFRGDISRRKTRKVLICGCGALGSWLSDLLVRQGYNSLTLLDKDKVEESNFGTQNFGKADIGRFKAQQMASSIFRRIGGLVKFIDKTLTCSNAKLILPNYELVIDLFDNGESRECIRQTCLDFNIECVHAGLAAMGYFEVKWNKGYISPTSKPGVSEDEAPCDYPMASNLVLMCVATLAEVINRFVDRDEKVNSTFWLNSMSLEIEKE